MSDPLALLRDPLESLGFRKRAGQIYTIELAGDVVGWLGLNKATRNRPSGQVEINPVVGVRHRHVERVVAELTRTKLHDYQPPTVSTPIGYLLPNAKYTAWVVGEGAPSDAIEDLTAALGAYALPFMQSLVSLAALRDALERGLSLQPEYRLPVVVALSGRPEEAADIVREAVDELGGRKDGAAELYRRFAGAFLGSEISSH
jgi:hypothetical protein